jgi:hypothetical protein
VEQTWTLAELSAALERYQAQAEASPLALSTKHTYVIHARRFVDWLSDDYQFPTEESPGRHRVS